MMPSCPVPDVTANLSTRAYLLPIGSSRSGREMERDVTKFYSLLAAFVVFAPMAYATLTQATQIWA